MTIMHIYRAQALVDPLLVLHNNMRCLALSRHADSMVGWDMPIEKENLWIRKDVHPPNEDNIKKYVNELNFTSRVADGVRDIWRGDRQGYQPKEIKNIDNDVAKIKEWLYANLIYDGLMGPIQQTQWDKFTQPVQRSKLLNKPANHKTPWAKMHECMFPRVAGVETYQAFVARHLDSHVTW